MHVIFECQVTELLIICRIADTILIASCYFARNLYILPKWTIEYNDPADLWNISSLNGFFNPENLLHVGREKLIYTCESHIRKQKALAVYYR